MPNGNAITEFVRLLSESSKTQMKVQTVWAIARKVDWNDKKMTAVGVSDHLAYRNVLLGLGGYYQKPVEGSLCLLGMIENKEAAFFLVSSDEIDRSEFYVGDFKIIVDEDGKIKIENAKVSLKGLFNSLVELLRTLKVMTPAGPSTNLVPDSLEKLEAFETHYKELIN